MEFKHELTKQTPDQPVIIKIMGNLMDKGQAVSMIEDIDMLIEEGFLNYIICMEEFKFMNSTGLNVLINVLTKTRNEGGETVLCCLPANIKTLIIVTKLNNVFTVADSLSDAQKLMEEEPKKQ